MNIRVPPMRHARSLTCTRSSSLIRPDCSASNTTYAVISFVRLAGGSCASAALGREHSVGREIDEIVALENDLRRRRQHDGVFGRQRPGEQRKRHAGGSQRT